jgi:two-component system, NtrC family, sensor kinase
MEGETVDCQPYLIIMRGPRAGDIFPLKDWEVGIGREKGNSLQINDAEISRFHAEIHRVGARFRLVDIHSANGVFVNGRLITNTELNPGDMIQIGQSLLEFRDRLPEQTPRPLDEYATQIVRRMPGSDAQRIFRTPDGLDEPSKRRLHHLAVLYQCSRKIVQISNLEKLMDQLTRLAFDTLCADHACLMLREPGGEWRVHAFQAKPGGPSSGETVFSRSIAEAVLTADDSPGRRWQRRPIHATGKHQSLSVA